MSSKEYPLPFVLGNVTSYIVSFNNMVVSVSSQRVAFIPFKPRTTCSVLWIDDQIYEATVIQAITDQAPFSEGNNVIAEKDVVKCIFMDESSFSQSEFSESESCKMFVDPSSIPWSDRAVNGSSKRVSFSSPECVVCDTEDDIYSEVRLFSV